MAIEQRIGRIDRIGQTREVFIFNLVTAGTIEDEVLRILDEKINMFELVVGEVGAILGEVDEQQEFSTLVLDAWLQAPSRRAPPPLPRSRTSCSRHGGNTTGSSSSTTRCSGTNSMPPDIASDEQGRMQGFVAALLRHEGALVEPIEPEGLEVLAPPPVQHALGIGELSRLGFGTTLPAGCPARRDGGRLARSLRPAAGPAGPLRDDASCRRRRGSPGDPEQVLGHELVLDNATFRLLDVAPALDTLSGVGFPRLRRLGRQARLHGAAGGQSGDRRAAGRGTRGIGAAVDAPGFDDRGDGAGEGAQCRRQMPICRRTGIARAAQPRRAGAAVPAGRGAGSVRQGPAAAPRPGSGPAAPLPQRSASRGDAPRRALPEDDPRRRREEQRAEAIATSIARSSTIWRASMPRG